MRRREFITLLGGAAATWPLAARAQQRERMRRVAVIMNQAAGDTMGNARVTALEHALQELGWTIGRNVQIEYRWAAANAARSRQYAAELVALGPDVILATGGFGVGPVLQATSTIPIVFVSVLDPVGAGYVESLARPGGNATGFINFEYSTGSKWPELLKQMSPSVNRVAVLRDPSIPSGSGQLGSIQTAASSLGMEVRPVDARKVNDLERVLTAFSHQAHGGLVVTASAPTLVHRELIVKLASRNKLPAIYPYRYFAEAGGLISYGPDTIDQFRRAAGYVDRILKGEKPADLPVQAPTKFELVINLKTAKALGLDVPPTLLARADEVIE
jgi:putative ABC transport system substrate-binding protein